MSRDPRQRYASAREFAEALRAVQTELGISPDAARDRRGRVVSGIRAGRFRRHRPARTRAQPHRARRAAQDPPRRRGGRTRPRRGHRLLGARPPAANAAVGRGGGRPRRRGGRHCRRRSCCRGCSDAAPHGRPGSRRAPRPSPWSRASASCGRDWMRRRPRRSTPRSGRCRPARAAAMPASTPPSANSTPSAASAIPSQVAQTADGAYLFSDSFSQADQDRRGPAGGSGRRGAARLAVDARRHDGCRHRGRLRGLPNRLRCGLRRQAVVGRDDPARALPVRGREHRGLHRRRDRGRRARDAVQLLARRPLGAAVRHPRLRAALRDPLETDAIAAPAISAAGDAWAVVDTADGDVWLEGADAAISTPADGVRGRQPARPGRLGRVPRRRDEH